MAKLTDFKSPTGATGNIFSLSSWTQMILGSMVLIITFALGQNLVQRVGAKVPIDTQIDPLIKSVAVSSAPAREVY